MYIFESTWCWVHRSVLIVEAPLTNKISVVIIVFVDGFIKPHTPGSLREPAQTYLFPSNWLTLPLSFGLLMSPWGGHSVFPNIYRDMRHPQKFPKAVKTTFSFTVCSRYLFSRPC
jgi:amino acid permease